MVFSLSFPNLKQCLIIEINCCKIDGKCQYNSIPNELIINYTYKSKSKIVKYSYMGQQQSKQKQGMLTLKSINTIIPKSTKQAMTDTKLGYIYLGGGRWKQYDISLYTPFVLQWKIEKGLVLDSNHNPYILNQIIEIKFENLLELSLRENNIESIEVLPNLQIPKIQKIFFCQNNITSIKPLRRLHTPQLGFLSFNGNQTLETKYLAYLDSSVLQELFIHLNDKQFIMLGYLAKLKSSHFTKICLGKYNQKKQDKCYKTLTKKYTGFIMDEFTKDRAKECGMKG